MWSMANYSPTRYVQFDDKDEAIKAVEQTKATYNGEAYESVAGKYMAVVQGEALLLVARWREGIPA
jgi:hypothetical protein